MRLVRDFDRVRIYSPTAEHARAVAEEGGAEAVASAEEAVRGADVVVTATNASEPVLSREWLKEGAHVNAIGGRPPQMTELDPETIAAAALYVDRRESAENEAGDYRRALEEGAIGPDHIRAELGEVLIGSAAGRSGGELTIFRSLGLAVEDLAAAEYVVRRARETGAGTEVRLLIPLEEIRRAQETIAGTAVRTPLVRLHAPESPAEIYLKLENLQPIGSFKIRGAYNAARKAGDVSAGLVTASAGNMAQGVAWAARELGVPCTVIAPDHAPETKVAAIERLGGRVIKLPFAEWWTVIEESRYEGVDGVFLHPVENEDVMAGNGTIGLELLEDLPDPDAVLVPWGGGGLLTGIASAVKALRPETKVYGCEIETAAPLNATLEAGEPTGDRVPDDVRRRRRSESAAAEDVGAG